ncbi:MAG: SHOCT domain-containing protein [Arcobacteraceae bacterium]
MKVISIIGIVWFTLSMFFIFLLINEDMEAAAGWGILGLLYAIPYSITMLVLSNKQSKSSISTSDELIKLHDLKEKGILTENEFNLKKAQLL